MYCESSWNNEQANDTHPHRQIAIETDKKSLRTHTHKNGSSIRITHENKIHKIIKHSISHRKRTGNVSEDDELLLLFLSALHYLIFFESVFAFPVSLVRWRNQVGWNVKMIVIVRSRQHDNTTTKTQTKKKANRQVKLSTAKSSVFCIVSVSSARRVNNVMLTVLNVLTYIKSCCSLLVII